ncbi:hypothetical protein MKW98_028480 [Papaver atlanticum]|uniref:CR-type domain-containing protein n=1 Tax=Papaver atlanticum TaxID=357466 RepID=A0AAD4TGN1_9MAGN|nr:hypothetical protein MKW98_028480 [Papaver atlanticum]
MVVSLIAEDGAVFYINCFYGEEDCLGVKIDGGFISFQSRTKDEEDTAAEKFSLAGSWRKGSKGGSSNRCGCQGSGMKISTRRIGPGMIQQMQHVCPECKGSGEVINEKDKCQQCKGNKVTEEKKVLEVQVEKGM